MTSGPVPDPWLLAATTIGAGIVACGGTRALVSLLRRAAMLDHPNERSLHRKPVPRGGGLAVVAAVVGAWLALAAGGAAPVRLVLVIGGALLLAAVSWRDDRRGLPPVVRLAVQLVAVAIGMPAVLPEGAVLQGWLPPWLDAIAAAFAWLWFVNLFNFMDGIDGLAGSEAATIGLGLTLFAGAGVGADPGFAALGAAIAVAAIGFLVWNW